MPFFIPFAISFTGSIKEGCYLVFEYPVANFNPTEKSGIFIGNVWYDKDSKDAGADSLATYRVVLKPTLENGPIIDGDTMYVAWGDVFGETDVVAMDGMRQYVLEHLQQYLLTVVNFFGTDMTSGDVTTDNDWHALGRNEIPSASIKK